MKVEFVTKMVPRTFVIINGKEFSLSTVVDILTELEGTDGFFTAIGIYNDDLHDCLEAAGVIKTNIRGGSYRGPNYEQFRDTYFKDYL